MYLLTDLRTVVRCPAIPDWPSQTVDTHNNTYNTTVTFWCDVGYVLFDNTTARSIRCLADGAWSANLPPCNRLYLSSLLRCVRRFIISGVSVQTLGRCGGCT